jgi:D-amino-acid dehydrogenase
MARVDAIVLGAGIVGVSAALHLAKRGLAVAVVDRQRPGEGTSYGNAGVIGGAGVYPTPFPRDLGMLLRVGLKQAPQANYHLADLPRLAPWLWAYFRASAPDKLAESARALRPLMAAAVAEHEALLQEAGALRYLRKDGWISIYRDEASFRDMDPQLALGAELGVRATVLDVEGARALEPSLSPVFAKAIHWPDIASVSNPLAVTQAYVARLSALGGLVLTGDARSLHRSGELWRVDTAEGPVDAPQAVVSLGPWAQDLLDPLGVRLPLAVKRGYHRHYRPRGNETLRRPIVDVDRGYALAPMEQGLRLTTGAEFARREAAPTPVQFDRLLADARALAPIGEQAEAETWLGSRPCFPDMRPAIGPAPGQPGLWLNYGHNHFGLTLGPVSGRLLAEMMLGDTPFCDPAPFAAERFRT